MPCGVRFATVSFFPAGSRRLLCHGLCRSPFCFLHSNRFFLRCLPLVSLTRSTMCFFRTLPRLESFLSVLARALARACVPALSLANVCSFASLSAPSSSSPLCLLFSFQPISVFHSALRALPYFRGALRFFSLLRAVLTVSSDPSALASSFAFFLFTAIAVLFFFVLVFHALSTAGCLAFFLWFGLAIK